MTQRNLTTAQEAFAKADTQGLGFPFGRNVSFVCPFPNCRVFAQHHWGVVDALTIKFGPNSVGERKYGGGRLSTAYCEACSQEAVFLKGQMIWPLESESPAPAQDLPSDLVRDYEEAREICRASPRGAAALLRLLIQKLCAELGSPHEEINTAIGGFVTEGRISPAIQKALDAVRVIGNEAVHPGTMDLRDDTATANSLFGLINFIVEKMITEPKEIDAIYNSLPPAKLAGIAQRDS